MQKSCASCGSNFEITDDDLAFLGKISPTFGGKIFSIPPPDLCYDCRQQRRLAQRNERNLYKRQCDMCQKNMISVYSSDKQTPVYCPTCWYGDGWDPLTHQLEYDFHRSFFEQFHDLWRGFPKMGILTIGDNINSEYIHNGYRLKNCYLIFDGEQAEDSYYGELYGLIKDCCDFFFLKECQLCYECVLCQNCFDLQYSRFCSNCSNSLFLLDCVSCRNCIGCVNLRQKEYHIFNEPVSEEEFERRKHEFHLETHSGVESLRAKCEKFFLSKPRRASRGLHNENVSGDNLHECKDTFHSFDCLGVRDGRYCTNCMMGGNDIGDIDAWGDQLSVAYNCAYIGAGANSLIGCFYVGMGASNVYYSMFCMLGASHCFGCVGLKKHSYCILNKQYSKEEYEALIPKIIHEMENDNEWGAFFPPNLSAFAYNETVAQDYFPLTKEQAIAKGWSWRDKIEEMQNVEKVIDANLLPDSIADIPDDILNWALRCESTKHPYRIQKAELAFYRKMNIPIPRKHFDVRHAERIALRNPRKLWKRACGKCGKEMQTTYAPERPEIVYCEECYLKEVY